MTFIHRICAVSLCSFVLAAQAFSANIFAAVLTESAFSENALDQARDRYENSDFAGAQNILNNLLRTEPSNASALSLLATVLDAQKKYPEASQAYERALNIEPNSPSLLNNFGNHLLVTGDKSAARDKFMKVVSLRPDHPNANLQLAILAVDETKGGDALHYLSHLSPADREQPQLEILTLRALYLTGRNKEAEQLVTKLSASSDPHIQFSLGIALAEAGKYKNAENCFSRNLESVPGDFDVLYNLGLAAYHAGDRQRAREVLQIALTQRPDDIGTLYNLAIVNIDLNNREQAIPLLVRAAKADPSRSHVLRTLADTESALGYYRDATAAYEQYLKLAPKDEAAQRELAFMIAVSGDRQDGLAKLQAVIKLHPNDVTAHYELGVASVSSNPDQASAELSKALALQAGFAPARFARGVLLCLNGKTPEALADLEFAARQYPDNAVVLDRLGKAYIDLNRYADAIGALRKASELSPRDASIFIHLSRAYAGAGQKDDSRAALAQYRAIGSQHIGEIPPLGFADLLSLPPDRLYAQYRRELLSRLADQPNEPGLNVRYLKLLSDEDRKSEADSEAERLLSLKLPDPLVDEAARTLLDSGDYNHAKSLLELSAKQSSASADPNLQFDLAIALLHTSGPDAALALIDRLPVSQRNADYAMVRAQILDALGKTDEALSSLRDALHSSSNRPALYERAAIILFQHQNPHEAVDLLEEAARNLPDDRKILLLQAAAFAYATHQADAERVLTHIENRWPEWAPAYVTYGILLESQKRAEDAKSQLETALALGASSSEVYYYLAKAALVATPDHLDQASRSIAQAIALSPYDPLIQALAGRIAYSQQDYRTAIEHLQRAIELRPAYLQAHYTLAQAYRALGMKDEAQRESTELDRLKKNNPNDDEDSVAERLLPTSP